MVTIIPGWPLVGLIVALAAIVLFFRPLRQLLEVLNSHLAMKNRVKRETLDAQIGLKRSEIERRTAATAKEAAKARADADVAAGLVQARITAETEVVAADAKTRAATAAAARPAKAKAQPTRRSLAARIGDAIWDLREVIFVVVVIAAAIFGFIQMDKANNRPHHSTVLVCKASVEGKGVEAKAVLVTSGGTYVLDPGFYGTTFYADGDLAVEYFHANQTYQLTYHGGILIGHFVTQAEVATTTGQTCAGI